MSYTYETVHEGPERCEQSLEFKLYVGLPS